MSDEIVFKAETTEGHVVELKLAIEEAIKMIAKAMLMQGTSEATVSVDDLHNATIALQWVPKEVKGLGRTKKNAGHAQCGDDDCA